MLRSMLLRPEELQTPTLMLHAILFPSCTSCNNKSVTAQNMQLPHTHMHALPPLAGKQQALMYTCVPLSTRSTRVSRVH